jgi:hypothetical protein
MYICNVENPQPEPPLVPVAMEWTSPYRLMPVNRACGCGGPPPDAAMPDDDEAPLTAPRMTFDGKE